MNLRFRCTSDGRIHWVDDSGESHKPSYTPGSGRQDGSGSTIRLLEDGSLLCTLEDGDAIPDSLVSQLPDNYAAEFPGVLFLFQITQKNADKLLFAESCTGGMLSQAFSAIPGSSGSLLGSIVSYHNQLKTGVLQVPEELLEEHGAVSAPCALSMVRGLEILHLRAASLKSGPESGHGRHAFAAITGIAGPDSDMSHKPVGMVYSAIMLKHKAATGPLRSREAGLSSPEDFSGPVVEGFYAGTPASLPGSLVQHWQLSGSRHEIRRASVNLVSLQIALLLSMVDSF